MKIPIAKEVIAPICLLLFVGLMLLVWATWLGAILIGIGVLFAAFFRDPSRTAVYRSGDFISPADGRVVEIGRVSEDEYVKDEALKVGIFLSLFDVHMNYAPVSGEVAYLRYSPGRFTPANSSTASAENENNAIGIAGSSGRIMVRQIAGILARRIVCDCSVGSRLRAGQKIGMIKFGSRVDIYLPPGCRLFIHEGSRVKGGETLLGTFADETDLHRS